MEQIFPRSFGNSNQIKEYCRIEEISKNISFIDAQVPKSLTDSYCNPGWDIIDRKGKMWRPILGMLVGKIFENNFITSDDTAYRLLFCIEILHNSSLILDDIEDKSELRRNKKCVHILYGEDISINCGVSMLIIPVRRLINIINNEAKLYPEITNQNIVGKLTESYFQEMTSIHIGQALDIEMKYKRIPQIDTYNDIVLCKTGVFPRLIIKWMLSIMKIETLPYIDYKNRRYSIKDYFLEISDHLSIAFQIKDDLSNLEVSDVSANKGMIGEDIYEGKQSLMVLHSLNHSAKTGQTELRDELIYILKEHTKDQAKISRAISIMKELGSLEFANQRIEIHLKKCLDLCHNLRTLPVNKQGVDDLINLVTFLI